MSVVVCKVNKKNIEIAADSILARGWTKVLPQEGAPHVKLQKYDDTIVGSCGSAEEMHLMFHYLKTHRIEDTSEKGVLDFMLEFGRWKSNLTSSSPTFDNEYIIVCRGKAFLVNRMFVMPISDYHAIGAGQDYALGALYVGATAEQAVKAACDLCALVCEPIIVEKMEKAKE